MLGGLCDEFVSLCGVRPHGRRTCREPETCIRSS